MPSLASLLTVTALVVAAGAASSPKIVPPALRGVPNSVGNTLDLEGTTTDFDTIVTTIERVEVPSSVRRRTQRVSRDIVDPDTPAGYDLVFGPLNGANNAPGYMGSAFLEDYNVDACARECNLRGADGNGGACQYFNIWRAVVNDVPTTYTCSMYFVVADASSATNTGQGDLQVTFSRGYKRQNFIVDGGFENYDECDDFCFTESYTNWVGSSPSGGYLDASVFYFATYARSGSATALLGSATFADDKSGTLQIANPLNTEAGKKYQVAFFQNSAFSGPTFQAKSIIQVLWNGKVVETIKPGFTEWKFHSVNVEAVGNDILAFRGGAAPAWTFLDDIAVWPLFQ